MIPIDWTGVMPAMTTEFTPDGHPDLAWVTRQAERLAGERCAALIPHGSLGEGQTLSFDEKIAVHRTVVNAVGDRIPVIPGIAAASTAEAVALAREAEAAGCHGLMVLPAYGYATDWRETKAHVSAVLRATLLPCLLYNNPSAYGTDFQPAHIEELAAEHANLEAVKESSVDASRIAEIRRRVGSRLAVGVGLDENIKDGILHGAAFWVAGLVNAFPAESWRLFVWGTARFGDEAQRLFDWFLPLLKFDTGPKFVQRIKLVQSRLGLGSERVRPPRLPLVGAEREADLEVIERALDTRPKWG